MTLTDFLLARLDEDQQVAEAADTEPRWEHDGDGILFACYMPLGDPRRCDQHPEGAPNDCDDRRIAVAEDDFCEPGLLDHVARHDPARVLADVAAKRAVVKRCALVMSEFEATTGMWPNVNRREKSHAGATLLDLARPWRDHPDWRQEWNR